VNLGPDPSIIGGLFRFQEEQRSLDASRRRIRVFVVDDSALMRRALSQIIEAQDDMEVVDTASTGHEAVRRATELQPDITLMDIHMPDMDGIQATWLVSNKVPNGGVIMVTSEERIDFIQKAMAAGAQGYVLKEPSSCRPCERSTPASVPVGCSLGLEIQLLCRSHPQSLASASSSSAQKAA
jgi:DNA-binding NarL/FixJ family response regulator